MGSVNKQYFFPQKQLVPVSSGLILFLLCFVFCSPLLSGQPIIILPWFSIKELRSTREGPLYLAMRYGDVSWGFVSYPQTSPFVVFCTCLTTMPAPMFPIQFCFPLPWHLPSGAALVHLQMIHLSFRSPPWAAGKLSHLEALSPWSPRC